MPAELIINDSNYHLFTDPNVVGREMGLIPRDFTRNPVGYCAAAKPFDLPLIPQGEWQARLDDMVAKKYLMSDIRNRSGPAGGPIPSLDQDGYGYCWCHSGVSANILIRAANNQPFADLSAFMVGCLVKNYRNQGGWCTQGVEFMAEHGCATSKTWSQRSAARSNDNPAMREEAKKYVITEWMDLDPRYMWEQLVTCCLLGIPVATDFNWWGHSVCTMDIVSLNPRRIRILNSWGDSWSDNGAGILEGSKALPDGAIAPRVIRAAA